MFGITLTLIHTQHTGHGISEGKCGVTIWCVDNQISGPSVPEPPCDVQQVPVQGKTKRLDYNWPGSPVCTKKESSD
jgi:hypothetical protein